MKGYYSTDFLGSRELQSLCKTCAKKEPLKLRMPHKRTCERSQRPTWDLGSLKAGTMQTSIQYRLEAFERSGFGA